MGGQSWQNVVTQVRKLASEAVDGNSDGRAHI